MCKCVLNFSFKNWLITSYKALISKLLFLITYRILAATNNTYVDIPLKKLYRYELW